MHDMKHLRITIALLLLTVCTFSLSAQRSRWGLGPVIGVNFSDFAGKDAGDLKFKTGFAGGLLVNYSDQEHFGFNTKFLYSQYGAKDEGDFTSNFNYLQVPFVATYYFGGLEDNFRPKIFAGPYFSVLLGASTDDERFNDEAFRDLWEDFDVGLTSGLGFNYLITSRCWLNVDLLYTVGINDVPVADEGDIHTQAFGIQVGAAFNLGDGDGDGK